MEPCYCGAWDCPSCYYPGSRREEPIDPEFESLQEVSPEAFGYLPLMPEDHIAAVLEDGELVEWRDVA